LPDALQNALQIRPVRRSDLARWLPLWDGYNAFYGRSGQTALDPEITRVTWERFFAERSGFVVYRKTL